MFPDTYRFARHTEPVEMVAAMVKRFRQAAQGIGLTADYHRTVTLASLVEKETPLDAERTMVASVFVNRLAQHMPLMTDPSVIYAALLDGRYRGTIYQSDLHANSAYNTYRHAARRSAPPMPVRPLLLRSAARASHCSMRDTLCSRFDPSTLHSLVRFSAV